MEAAFRKILIPIDFTINSLTAIKKACESADKEALLHLLHVQCYGYPLLSFSAARFLQPNQEKDYSEAEIKLYELRNWVKERFPHIRVSFQIDTKRDIQQGIINTAKAIDADLIVIGTRSRHKWFSFLKTVRPEKIQKRTSLPVMIVRSGAPDIHLQSILVPVNDGLNEHKIKVIECLCRNYDATVFLLKFNKEKIFDESHWPIVRLQYLKRIRVNLRCEVKWQFITAERNGDSIKKIAQAFNPGFLVLESGQETKMNGLTGQIFDHLDRLSPIQVIITN